MIFHKIFHSALGNPPEVKPNISKSWCHRNLLNTGSYYKMPKFQKAENLFGRKYGRKIGAGGPSLAPRTLRSTHTHLSAIFSHLNNNWDI